MAVTVGLIGTKVKTLKVAGQTTQVKKIVVGTPVRRVNQAGSTLAGLMDVDFTDLNDGSVMVFDNNTGKWKSTLILDKQDITGGQY